VKGIGCGRYFVGMGAVYSKPTWEDEGLKQGGSYIDLIARVRVHASQLREPEAVHETSIHDLSSASEHSV